MPPGKRLAQRKRIQRITASQKARTQLNKAKRTLLTKQTTAKRVAKQRVPNKFKRFWKWSTTGARKKIAAGFLTALMFGSGAGAVTLLNHRTAVAEYIQPKGTVHYVFTKHDDKRDADQFEQAFNEAVSNGIRFDVIGAEMQYTFAGKDTATNRVKMLKTMEIAVNNARTRFHAKKVPKEKLAKVIAMQIAAWKKHGFIQHIIFEKSIELSLKNNIPFAFLENSTEEEMEQQITLEQRIKKADNAPDLNLKGFWDWAERELKLNVIKNKRNTNREEIFGKNIKKILETHAKKNGKVHVFAFTGSSHFLEMKQLLSNLDLPEVEFRYLLHKTLITNPNFSLQDAEFNGKEPGKLEFANNLVVNLVHLKGPFTGKARNIPNRKQVPEAEWMRFHENILLMTEEKFKELDAKTFPVTNLNTWAHTAFDFVYSLKPLPPSK